MISKVCYALQEEFIHDFFMSVIFKMDHILYIMMAYAILAMAIPSILTKPTKIDLIDNTVIYLETTKSYIVNATLFVGLVVYLVHTYGPGHDLPSLE